VTAGPFSGVRSVLFAHAHPDDETLSSGGLVLWLVARGVRVALLTATRGERGEVVPRLSARMGDGGQRLTAVRVDELRRATSVLGISDAYLLGTPPARAAGLMPRRYADSGMRWVTDTLAGPADETTQDALTAADPADVRTDVLALIRSIRPDLVVGYDDLGGYGHPDHRAIRRAALEACRDSGTPFAELVPPEADGAFVVDAADRLDEIADALHAHATQLTVDGAYVVHSGGQREPIRTAYGVRLVP
jgi:N-acetyl-1-D-myo-inositol-2-amino-2-deoxy-alpha-D-glucopyranoside deacetylase